ncbi:hypothetical protein [Rhodovulum marinum]|uniref:DUF4177 domain-containing protein n=1 Tax=Rhodovulum marinum TaxID=320662 RepID=A0A4R2Q6X0_9RHOB|nr:hypothetical protein [Rhodovulum marinum]TCP44457.1 hypothetical protein EV662_101551 [Rhodovulum marinum]
MQNYEFTAIPAPARVGRFGGLTSDEAFSAALTEIMNEMGAGGWDFVGAEIMSSRVGRWPFARTRAREVLVFRRSRGPERDLMRQMQQMMLQLQHHQSLARLESEPVEVTVRPRRVPKSDTPRPVRKLRPRLDIPTAAHATAAE